MSSSLRVLSEDSVSPAASIAFILLAWKLLVAISAKLFLTRRLLRTCALGCSWLLLALWLRWHLIRPVQELILLRLVLCWSTYDLGLVWLDDGLDGDVLVLAHFAEALLHIVPVIHSVPKCANLAVPLVRILGFFLGLMLRRFLGLSVQILVLDLLMLIQLRLFKRYMLLWLGLCWGLIGRLCYHSLLQDIIFCQT